MATDLEVRIRPIMEVSDMVSNIGVIQKSLNTLKMPDKLGSKLTKNISEFYKEYQKYQDAVAGGVKTKGNSNTVIQSLTKIKTLYNDIVDQSAGLSKLDLSSMLNVDVGKFKEISAEMSNIYRQLSQIKLNPKDFASPLQDLRASLKNDKFSAKGGLIDQLSQSVSNNDLASVQKYLKLINDEAAKIMPKQNAQGIFEKTNFKLDPANATKTVSALQQMGTAFDAAAAKAQPLNQKLDELETNLRETKTAASGEILGNIKQFEDTQKAVDGVIDSTKQMHQKEFNFNKEVDMLDSQIQSYFGLSQMIRKVGQIAREAFSTVKELDKAMTETAVVTNFDVSDMWEMLPTYTAQANQLGATIKDVYEATTLYYQQGMVKI